MSVSYTHRDVYKRQHYMRLVLGEFIKHQYKVKDLAFGQLTEQFIHDYKTLDVYKSQFFIFSEASLFICLGKPTKIRSTGSLAT